MTDVNFIDLMLKYRNALDLKSGHIQKRPLLQIVPQFENGMLMVPYLAITPISVVTTLVSMGIMTTTP